MLHITNGDFASQRIRELDIEGGQLAWSDVLHEGPVPGNLTLEEMSMVRASFIADCGWATNMEAQFHFQTRDAVFLSAANTGDVVLWVTHELYDQLHMMQVLAWYATEGADKAKPELVFIDQHLSPDTPAAAVTEAFSNRRQATQDDIQQAYQAWVAFTALNPRSLESIAAFDTRLPFLKAGIERLKHEYPDQQGISLTERHALTVLADSVSAAPYELFGNVRLKEAVPFMGDASFWRILKAMTESAQPLMTCDDQARFELPGLYQHADNFNERRLAITDAGRAVLAGELDWLVEHAIHRWVGGVRLQSPGCWRFDTNTQSFVRK